MIIRTYLKVAREGINLVSELRAKQISKHAQIISNKDVKDKVDDFLKDMGAVLEAIQNEIKSIVDLPDSSYEGEKGRLVKLRSQEKNLIGLRDQVLEFAA